MYLDETSQPHGVMDLRGIAKLSNNRWIICGGMESNQIVSNRTFLLESNSLDLPSQPNDPLEIRYTENGVKVTSHYQQLFELVDVSGRVVKRFEQSKELEIKRSEFKQGTYLLRYNSGAKTIRIY
jgi:hypothetical protein